jgi:hypothetical protein
VNDRIAFLYPVFVILCAQGISFAAEPGAITGRQRVDWITVSTTGPSHLVAGTLGAMLGTATNDPQEYGGHWDGFAKRDGLWLSSSTTGIVMEAGLGKLWGEDPRYVRATGRPIKSRIGNVLKMTFVATNREGAFMPAYARYIAIPGSNFLSNTWRPDSQANVNDALVRTSLGFVSRMGANAFAEFWPDVKRRVFRRR